MTDRLSRYRKGRWAEIKTAVYLTLKGYRIKAWRYKTPQGEIDLIATKGKTLLFVEVKARDTKTGGVEAVSLKSRVRIQDAAMHFAARHRRYADYVWRFDVIVVMPNRLPYHMTDAWRA